MPHVGKKGARARAMKNVPICVLIVRNCVPIAEIVSFSGIVSHLCPNGGCPDPRNCVPEKLDPSQMCPRDKIVSQFK